MERIKFSKSEIDNVKSISGPIGMPVFSYETPVTPGENMRMLFEKQMPMWIPRFDDYGPMPILVNPDYTAKMFGGRDMFGVEWERVSVGFGTMVRPGHPLVTDINRWEDYVQMPDPDSWDWDSNYEEVKKAADPDKLTNVIFYTGFFERLISLMDFADAAVALIDEDQQEGVHRLFRTCCDIYKKILLQYKRFGANVITFHDDWGSQRAPFFSPDTVREMLLPYIKRIVDFIHTNGMYFDFHCCGKVEELVPLMIEAGMDAWSAQNINDFELVRKNHGEDIILVINPDVDPALNADENALNAAARAYIGRFGRKGALMQSLFVMPPEIDKHIYMESRKAYCG
ncbi:MAG: hypothetical protein GXY05_08100 [Clostridiales bacterium]|nr:hypothetical protein [Clostridiales bacterium]